MRNTKKRLCISGLLFLAVPTMALANDWWLHMDSTPNNTCYHDSMAAEWRLRNNTRETKSISLNRTYTHDAVTTIDAYTVTVGGGQDIFLGCNAWHGYNTGSQTFSFGPWGYAVQAPPQPP